MTDSPFLFSFSSKQNTVTMYVGSDGRVTAKRSLATYFTWPEIKRLFWELINVIVLLFVHPFFFSPPFFPHTSTFSHRPQTSTASRASSSLNLLQRLRTGGTTHAVGQGSRPLAAAVAVEATAATAVLHAVRWAASTTRRR